MNNLIDGLTTVEAASEVTLSQVKILPEPSIFEYDPHGMEWHQHLPDDIKERVWYFPRVDPDHEPMFTPALPENKDQFLERCAKVWPAVAERFPADKHKVLIMVSHAAGCIGLSHKGAQRPLNEITPAAPCSIFRLQQFGKGEWSLDKYDDEENGMNGFTKHLSTIGPNTTPWNSFNGYTGPLDSKFAPK